MNDRKIKVIKKGDEPQRRIRPIVIRKILLDEKSRLMKRVREIDRQLQTA